MDTKPLDSNCEQINVMMSTYNGERFVDEQIRSICLQEDVNVSLLVRDDGSQDSTIEVLKKWIDTLNISIINGENIGTARSFLELIKAVKQEENAYYAFSDQDDYWLPNKIKIAIKELKPYDGIPALYYSNIRYVDSNLNEMSNPYKRQYYTTELKGTMVIAEAPGCTMVFNSTLLELLKQYFPVECHMHDVWVLNVCAALNGKIIYDKESRILYRQHEDNVVSSLGKSNYGRVGIWVRRFKNLFNFNYKPTLVAQSLLHGFGDEIDRKSKDFLILLVDSKSSIRKRFEVAMGANKDSPYWEHNLRFAIQTLLNRH